VDRLEVRDAHKRKDRHLLLGFRCWSGDEDETWVLEVEEYIRLIALRTAERVLLFEPAEGQVAGVTAFGRQEISPSGTRRVPGWRLEVVALALAWQGKSVVAAIAGCAPRMKASEYLLRATFRRMRELDRRRRLVVARVHDGNVASMVAAARVGLDRTRRESDEYWEMLGEADPAAGPT
jgi:hypothetical protein